MTRANFGYLGRFNKKLNYSPIEKFEMGGSGLSSYSYFNVDIVPMRGYDDQSISYVVNPNTGQYENNTNVYNKFTLELRYPVTLKEQATIYGLAFMEAGNAWYDIKSFNPFEVKRTAGFGVRVFLPMFGMLGFDVGYGFDKVYDGGQMKKPGWVPQFIMGQQF
jgi:outer membrane protein insertion porin family